MREHLELVCSVLDNGERKSSRTGVDTISAFAAHYRVDLVKGFPLLTTKKMHWNSALRELLCYLSGDNHIRKPLLPNQNYPLAMTLPLWLVHAPCMPR